MIALQKKHFAQLKKKNNPSIDLQELQRTLELQNSGRAVDGVKSSSRQNFHETDNGNALENFVALEGR